MNIKGNVMVFLQSILEWWTDWQTVSHNVYIYTAWWRNDKSEMLMSVSKGEGKVFMWAKWPIRAGAYTGFLNMKQLGVFLLPLDGMLVHRRVTPSSKFASTHLCTWLKRGTMRVKCLAQEHNRVPRPGIEPGLLDQEFRALTIRPPRVWGKHKILVHVTQCITPPVYTCHMC